MIIFPNAKKTIFHYIKTNKNSAYSKSQLLFINTHFFFETSNCVIYNPITLKIKHVRLLNKKFNFFSSLPR